MTQQKNRTAANVLGLPDQAEERDEGPEFLGSQGAPTGLPKEIKELEKHRGAFGEGLHLAKKPQARLVDSGTD